MERSPQVDRLEKVIQQQAKTIQQLEARLFHPMSPQEQPLEDQDSFVADMRHQVSPSLPNQHQSQVHPHRTYRTLPNGGRLVQYRNGTEREYWSNGTVVTKYMNGDVKTQAAEKVTYWHQKEQTTQTIQNNGVQVFEYPDRQIEKHYPDGSKEVTFPSGKIKKILPNKSPQHETS
jgi:centromere protein J